MTLYKRVGRILVRSKPVVGLFLPFDDLKSGIYDLDTFDDEFILRYVGMPSLPDRLYEGLSIEQLVNNHNACLTSEEYLATCQA